MRRKSSPRVVGPYLERGKWRIVVVENNARKSHFFLSEKEALKHKAGLAKEVAPPPSRKLADMLAEWAATRVRSGTCKPQTAREHAVRMRLFLAPFLERDIAALTPRAAAALYQQHTEQPSAKTGQPLSASTHRFDRLIAQELFRWAIQRGYVGANPFVGVKPIGKTKAGKPQLRIEEARQFTATAIQVFEEERKPLAIGVLLALTMGLRTSEVLRRVVRDLDDGARYLWIDYGKTANARRHLEIPMPLQPYLLQLASGKAAEEPLFGLSEKTHRPRPRQSLFRMVQEICQRARVPRVCTHSLRGLWATLAVGSGVASHAVAASLGHHSFAMTQKHYAQPAAIVNAGTARVASVLDGGGGGGLPSLSARDLLRQLEPETLAELAQLLKADKGKGDASN
jgi:integrase